MQQLPASGSALAAMLVPLARAGACACLYAASAVKLRVSQLAKHMLLTIIKCIGLTITTALAAVLQLV